MKKILVVAPNWIGDALFTTAAVRMIKRAYPDEEISVLAVPRAAEVFENNPDVAHIVINQEESRPFWYPLALIQQLGKRDFDAAFLFHRSRSRAWWTLLAGIPLRIGYNTKGRGFLLTHSIPEPSSTLHRIEYLVRLLHQIGIPGEAPFPIFAVGDRAKEFVRQRLGGKKKFAVLNPGGNWSPKRWPADRFARLAGLLYENLGLEIVVTGSLKDKRIAQEIKKKASCDVRVMAGETTLEELGALIQAAELFVSNDSGPMHLAAALGTSLIALFGPTSSKITGPVGPGRIVVLQKDIGMPVPNPDPMLRDMRYMEAIEVPEVLRAAQLILGRTLSTVGEREG